MCNAVITFESMLIYSIKSISPSLGQFGPTVQKAGQTEHPRGAAIPNVVGKCSMSRTIRLLCLIIDLDFNRKDFRPIPLDVIRSPNSDEVHDCFTEMLMFET